MTKYKILVVDDSVFMRKIIADLIGEDPRFEVVDTARNGKEAVQKTKLLTPDAITLDIEMPEMNGLDALRLIMAEQPTPVIMLSSLTEEGAKETIEALEIGALDFVRKPSGSVSLDLFKVKEILMEKLGVAVNSKVRANPTHKPPQVKGEPKTPARSSLHNSPFTVPPTSFPGSADSSKVEQLVAIGTSTGGPRALYEVLTNLPGRFPAPIVIVQHMPPNFTRSLAQRLDANSEIRVVEAAHGMQLENATAYIAPGGWHMGIERIDKIGYQVRLNKDEPRGGHRPCVDTMFETLIPLVELKRHIVVLTGMGSDGAQSMLGLRNAGAVQTIAESSETCVVYGMPRAAYELGGAMIELPLNEIAPRLIDSVAGIRK
ncbi:MAG: two-component system protein-glutamate methylesterase response regulator [Paenibacillus sp.]|nr:two-component system protein-glutamate methylesterase response regulator [Paenibacillus sp.]